MALSDAPSQTPPPAPIEPSQDTIKDRVSIHERPKNVDARTEGARHDRLVLRCLCLVRFA
jgi:hypothetical protein